MATNTFTSAKPATEPTKRGVALLPRNTVSVVAQMLLHFVCKGTVVSLLAFISGHWLATTSLSGFGVTAADAFWQLFLLPVAVRGVKS